MYALASSLTPESIHAASAVAFRELARAGVRTVGEFHYVHHQRDGTPYEDRTILADAVIDAVVNDLDTLLESVVRCEGERGIDGEFARVPVKIGARGVIEILES